MPETITLTKATLVNLLDGLLYPNPDDPGPYGPIGPIIRWALRDFSSVLLNPQPLPPLEPNPHPWRFFAAVLLAGLEPHSSPWPVPWFSAFLARTVIDQAVAQYRFAEVVTGTEQSEKTTAAIGLQIREFVDDWCGTRPPRWPRPWPWPPRFDPAKLRPLDLLIAGAQFRKAADFANNPLQAEFAAAADKLFETGLKRMESSCA
jgi:hypothetical protein